MITASSNPTRLRSAGVAFGSRPFGVAIATLTIARVFAGYDPRVFSGFNLSLFTEYELPRVSGRESKLSLPNEAYDPSPHFDLNPLARVAPVSSLISLFLRLANELLLFGGFSPTLFSGYDDGLFGR